MTALSNSLNTSNFIAAMTDPVSLEVMKKPVALSCGHSLDRKTAETIHGMIKNGFCEKREPCPLCKQVVIGYAPNYALQDIIEKLFGLSSQIELPLPNHSLVLKERKEAIEINSIPFPGISARFEHVGGSWETYHQTGGSLNRQIHFQSVIEESLFYKFSLLGYQDGDICISIAVNGTNRSDRINASKAVETYFRQLGIRTDSSASSIGHFMSANPEQTRKMFTLLALHNEIPTEHYGRIKEIVERGRCD